ncbi:hypothetical protein B4915_12615 [Leucobacter massiliensis]|uniref:Uncharacterized protein n=2 Tax=Leucobacter massiliensis TaxID=1686285 RepID=A0A2S9QKY4_9MICO|nr:hypothetical protein B4915_12615 [Leucobacter massiliensis]
METVVRIAEDTEFDPNQVTPGWEGFAATGAMAVCIILLGFLLVRRLRRNAYRVEARERIAAELAEQEAAAAGTAAGAAAGSAATDAAGAAGAPGTPSVEPGSGRDSGPRA